MFRSTFFTFSEFRGLSVARARVGEWEGKTREVEHRYIYANHNMEGSKASQCKSVSIKTEIYAVCPLNNLASNSVANICKYRNLLLRY